MQNIRRMNIRAGLWFAIGILFFAVTCHAEEITASPQSSAKDLARLLRSASPGDTVFVPAGAYCGPIKINNVKGTKEAPITFKASPEARFTPCEEKGGSVFLVSGSSHLVFDGLVVSGAERSITLGASSHITVTNAHLSDMSNYGVMAYKSNDITVTQSLIENSSREHGIYVSGRGKNVYIADNIIRNTHINGIHVNGRAENVRIIRNVLENIGHYPTKEGGAAVTFINGASSGLIANNVFKNIYGQCITIGGKNLRIKNNVFDGYSWSVLLGLPGSANITFTGNAVLEGDAVPFQVNGKTVATFSSDYNYFDLDKDTVFAWKKFGRFSLPAWQKRGQDVHSIVDSGIFSFTLTAGIPERYRLSDTSEAIDAGMPTDKDAHMPPGLGTEAADIGIFGGAHNAWPQE